MPKVAYSEQEREKIRQALVAVGFELISGQGIQKTTIEQVYKQVGISRTFFYTFFPSKEEFLVEVLYFQQPRLIAYAQKLMQNPNLSWKEAVEQFLYACCQGEKSGVTVLSIEEQQMIFHKLSAEAYQLFRARQQALFCSILETFGVCTEPAVVHLFANLSVSAALVYKAMPDTLPLLFPEAAAEMMQFQVQAIVDYMSTFRKENGKV